jgi:hypothetical protein
MDSLHYSLEFTRASVDTLNVVSGISNFAFTSPYLYLLTVLLQTK